VSLLLLGAIWLVVSILLSVALGEIIHFCMRDYPEDSK
jgi:hypothetical protein